MKRIIENLKKLPKFLQKPASRQFYGTAGYRGPSEYLESTVSRASIAACLEAAACGQYIGIMLTASHNHFSHNGIKMIDAKGFYMDARFEQLCDDLVNSPDSEFLDLFLAKAKNLIDKLPNAKILVGRDTRNSGSGLEKAVLDALRLVNVTGTSVGCVTTPQLHWLVRASNKENVAVSPGLYVDHLAKSYERLVKLWKNDEQAVSIDTAHGVGALVVNALIPRLPNKKITIINAPGKVSYKDSKVSHEDSQDQKIPQRFYENCEQTDFEKKFADPENQVEKKFNLSEDSQNEQLERTTNNDSINSQTSSDTIVDSKEKIPASDSIVNSKEKISVSDSKKFCATVEKSSHSSDSREVVIDCAAPEKNSFSDDNPKVANNCDSTKLCVSNEKNGLTENTSENSNEFASNHHCFKETTTETNGGIEKCLSEKKHENFSQQDQKTIEQTLSSNQSSPEECIMENNSNNTSPTRVRNPQDNLIETRNMPLNITQKSKQRSEFIPDPYMLNEQCGADFVVTHRRPPKNLCINPGPLRRVAAFDGDADRLIYFTNDPEFSLIDGDRIAVFLTNFIHILTRNIGPFSIGMVLSHYSNSAALKSVSNDVKTILAQTGVKHFVEAASMFDIGIFFEPNGHGSVTFSKETISKLQKITTTTDSKKEITQKAEILLTLADIFDPCVGDAIANFLVLEAILDNKSLKNLKDRYKNLPTRMLAVKIKDKNILKTARDIEIIAPIDLRNRLEQLCKAHRGRAFVRPSGTEDVVRVFAESLTADDADSLCVRVAQAVYDICDGIGKHPEIKY